MVWWHSLFPIPIGGSVSRVGHQLSPCTPLLPWGCPGTAAPVAGKDEAEAAWIGVQYLGLAVGAGRLQGGERWGEGLL